MRRFHFDPIFPTSFLPWGTLPASLRKRKASEKVIIPDTFMLEIVLSDHDISN